MDNFGDYIWKVKWHYEIGSWQKTNLSGKYISRYYLAFGGKQQLFDGQRTRPLFPKKNRLKRCRLAVARGKREMVDGARKMAF
jgi:hypothetical protein